MEMETWQLFGLIILKIKRITEKKYFACAVWQSSASTKFGLYIFRCSKYFYPDKHVGVTFVDIVIYERELEWLYIYSKV
jgi:hypothetical protein